MEFFTLVIKVAQRYFSRIVDSRNATQRFVAILASLGTPLFAVALVHNLDYQISSYNDFHKIQTGVCGIATSLLFGFLATISKQLEACTKETPRKKRQLLSLLSDNLSFAVALDILTFFTSLPWYMPLSEEARWPLLYLNVYLVTLLALTFLKCFTRMMTMIMNDNLKAYPEQVEEMQAHPGVTVISDDD